MMKFNDAGIRQFKRALVSEVRNICEDAIAETKPTTPVLTGRLQKSLRVSGAKTEGEVTTFTLLAGGVKLYGTVMETTIQKDVNYAFFVEIRKPFFRRAAIPALMRGVTNLQRKVRR